MKRLILLAVLILASFSSFSQSVILTEKQAKKVAKDVVEGEACKEELEQTQNVLELTETKVRLKDKIIQNLEDQKKDLLQAESLRIEQIVSKDKIIIAVEKQLKTQKKVSWIYKAGAFAGAVLSGILLVAK